MLDIQNPPESISVQENPSTREKADYDLTTGRHNGQDDIIMAQENKPTLHSASYIGDIKSVKELLTSPSCHLNATDQVGRTALHLAASKGHVDVVKELIKAGCGADRQDEHGNTALHECVWRGFSQTAEILCRAQANFYLKNKGAFAPLHLSCQNGHNQSCRVLLLSGCKPDIKNNYGDTAIHTSARYGHAGVMRILISAKANLNECNKNGDTGLHISAAMCKRKLTRILLESGCDQNIKNKQGETSVDIARRKGYSEIVEILSNPPPRVIEPSEKDKGKNKKKRSKESGTSKDSKDSGSRCRDRHKKNKNGHRVTFDDEEVKHHKKCIYKDKHGEVSPYGCHYYPSLTSFPPPKLDSLPSDPLQKGEQYFLDLAGNIKKGPVGVGYACYCIPFFQQVEKKLEADKLELMDHIDSAHEDLNEKISSLERRTRSQLFNLTQTMKEKLAGEKTDCLERVERRTLKERLELEKQQEIAADYIKTELKSWVQAKIDNIRRGAQFPKHNANVRRSLIKSEKSLQSITLVRSKSEELLSDVVDATHSSPIDSLIASKHHWQDYRNLGAKPKHIYEHSQGNGEVQSDANELDKLTKMSKSDGDLTLKIPDSKLNASGISNLSNNVSPNSLHSESGYGSRVAPNDANVSGNISMSNQPDILSMKPMISHNTVGLPNSDMNYRKFGDIPEPEFRITRQFFDTVSNQMEKWYERRLSSMERKSEEKSEHDRVDMKDRIQAIEQQLTNLKPSINGNNAEQENSASLV